MKGIVVIVFVLLMFTVNVWAGPFVVQDEEASQVALFIKNIVGVEFAQAVLDEYPKSELKWGGRSVPNEEGDPVYIIYCEVKPPKDEASYFYYEVKITPINGNTKLLKKYGLGG